MPVILTPVEQDFIPEDAAPESLIETITDKDGNLTLEGAITSDFIESVDFTDVFESEVLREVGLVTTSKGFAVLDESTNTWVEADKTDDGAEEVEIETLSADVLAECVDMDDMANMYGFYAVKDHAALSEGGIPEKTLYAAMTGMIDTEALNEYNKGSFVKLHKGKGGAALVNRMLGAMYYKGDIHRAKRTATNKYHAPSASGPETYTKGYSKAQSTDAFPTGKAAGKRTHPSWQAYNKKSASKNKQQAMKTLGAKTNLKGSKVTAQSIKKAALKKDPKAKDVAAKLKSKSKNKAKGSGKSLAESAIPAGDGRVFIDESAQQQLASRALRIMGKQTA